MPVKLHETPFLNRQTIRQGTPPVINELRYLLRKHGMNVDREMALDLSVPGILCFTYADGIRSAYSITFRLHPREPTREEKYMHNLREFKKKGRRGKYLT